MRDGVLSSDSNIFDYVSIENNIFLHKQIESRQGIVYMRMKKRVFGKK